ncbi:hypothetical protein N6L26_07370 [Qipengyuania sp. SS22]|uniref:hypothetical protein n=1 Tax=Qipengyuania sp. SS22 TaxID=2979461 RepID=UPI0021E52C61|nr:hypothetical protein [Qipengyuania sp. SS22]UYH53895.1 hypothetical protein N6L26_07370 [Qipengyuania sp. SS22]
MNVADLKAGDLDSAGHPVLHFYSRKPPEYAVYQTRERAMVHFADAPDVSDEQRKVLAQLAPLRGETNALIDDWREKPDRYQTLGFIPRKNGARIRQRAARYDRRIGDALIVALEGDLTGAGAVLQEIKDDVIEERVGWSRFEYLLVAITIAFAFILFSILFAVLTIPDVDNAAAAVRTLAADTATDAPAARAGRCDATLDPRCFADATNLWRGAMAGALGSFFSIALAIRGRTVLPDLNKVNNWMDAGLRVAIGIIAGTVLVALVVSDFVNLRIGNAQSGELNELYIGIVGFVGGFAERLVPDLLARAAVQEGEKPVLRKPEPDLDAAAAPAATAVGAASDDDTHEDDVAHDDEIEDGCVEDLDIGEDDLTRDEHLPAASGGVAQPADGPERMKG